MIAEQENPTSMLSFGGVDIGKSIADLDIENDFPKHLMHGGI